MLRRCYFTDSQFGTDSTVTARIRWYRCAPGAQFLGFPSLFGSAVWSGNGKEPYDGPGERPHPPQNYLRGNFSPLPSGTGKPCGQLSVWQNGWPGPDPIGLPRYSFGLAKCCGNYPDPLWLPWRRQEQDDFEDEGQEAEHVRLVPTAYLPVVAAVPFRRLDEDLDEDEDEDLAVEKAEVVGIPAEFGPGRVDDEADVDQPDFLDEAEDGSHELTSIAVGMEGKVPLDLADVDQVDQQQRFDLLEERERFSIATIASAAPPTPPSVGANMAQGLAFSLSYAMTWSTTTTSGSNLFIAICTASPITFSLPAGWASLTADSFGSGQMLYTFVAYAAASQATTTFTLSANVGISAVGVEVLTPSASAVDANVPSSGSGTTATTAATGTLLHANEVVVAVVAGLQLFGSPSWSNSFVNQRTAPSGAESTALASLVVSTTTSTSTSVTTFFGGAWATRIVSFY